MKCILVIDDDPTIRVVIRVGLEEEGYQIVELDSGTDAVEMIKSRPIDLVILDIFMDGKEGIETLSEIREVSNKLPIIVMSSSTEFFDISKDLGADHTISKPIDFETLFPLVNKLLN
ncbi:response regulator [uncultured Desulfuromusa sp.]|uniref:response regulator transcription factor n=1 Tax=uncultured Desulfuromusa sp. TaxID=219183 RepID=UPI002AA88C01|nr:response regulator [uncultured Desulfuromusa sp.]